MSSDSPTLVRLSRQILLAIGVSSSLVLFGHPGQVLAIEPGATVASDNGESETPEISPDTDRKDLFVVKDEPAFISSVCEVIERSARENDLPPAFLAKLIWKESRFDPNAISPMGAEGIAQFMPATAAKNGLENSFEPIDAIKAAAGLLGSLAKGYGNLGLAAAAYNAGEARVDAWRAGRSRLPGETLDYVYSITGHKAREWKRGKPPEILFVLDETRPFQAACKELPLFRAPLQRRFANTYFNRGLALAAKKNYEDAVVRYTIAIRLRPDFPHAYNNRGLVYRRMGDYESAISNYDAAIRLKPTYAAAYNNRGYALRKLGHYDEAIRDFSKAIKLKPDYVAAYFNRGFAKSRLGQFKEAIHDYGQAIARQANHPVALYNRAVAHLRDGNLQAARADFDRAIAVKSNFAKAYYRRAVLMRRLGKKHLALADYQKSVALEPGFAHERYKRPFQ